MGEEEPIQGVGDMLGLILIFLVADHIVCLENVDQYQPVEMSRSGNGKFGISEIELEQLGEYKPMIGYLLNAFTVTTLLLVLANVLNISLFPSVSEVVQSTGRSWKAGRSLEGLASAVDA